MQNLDIVEPNLVKQDSLKSVRDSYVDNIHIGDSQRDADRMNGNLDSSSKLIGKIPRLLYNIDLILKTLANNFQKG